MTGWSPEVRLLLSPAATFRQLAEERTGGAWTLLRRPLLLALVCGCTVSLQASGRLSARLVTDGMVSFAFIPIFETAALAAVYWREPRRVPFAQAADVFFTANAPWLLWLLAFAVLRSVQTPLQATALRLPLVWTLLLSLVLVAVWSAYIDLQFFRVVLPRQAGSAGADLLVQRAIGWTGIFGCFLGIAIWAQIAAWIGV